MTAWFEFSCFFRHMLSTKLIAMKKKEIVIYGPILSIFNRLVSHVIFFSRNFFVYKPILLISAAFI